MSSGIPYEIVAAPFWAYVAPVGTAFPDIDEDPSVSWTLIGTSGPLNYDESGVSVKASQKTDVWRALGSTGPRKAFRTEEELKISLKLADVSLEQYSQALNGNTVSTVAAAGPAAGYKSIGLSRGLEVRQYALLIRGNDVSPYGTGTTEDWNMQYEVPRAFQSGDPDVVYTKGKPAELALEWTALEDTAATSDDERFGRLIAQNADPAS